MPTKTKNRATSTARERQRTIAIVNENEPTATEGTPESVPDTNRIRWGRMLGLGLLALVALIAGVATWIINDEDRIRSIIETQVSELTGRPFHIDGEFSFSLGQTITVEASNVRWDNPAWNTDPYMLEIGRLVASIDAQSLLEGPVVISAAEASDANLVFEWTDAEQFNWQFFPNAPDEKDDEPPAPLPLLLTQANVKNVVVRFRHPNLTEEQTVTVLTAAHQEDADHRLVVSGDVLLAKEEELIVVTGQIGPFPELAVAGAVDFDIQAVGEIAQLSARGDFDWLARLRDPDFDIKLTAPAAATLLDRLNLPVITTGPIDLRSQINVEGDEVVAATVGQLGEFDVDATLNADSMTSFEGFALAVDASGPSAGKLLSLAGVKGFSDTPYQLEIKANRTERGLELQKFALDMTSMQVDATGLVQALPAFRNFNLEFNARGEDLRDVAEIFNLDTGRAIAFDLNAAVTSNGAGVDDDLVANLKLGRISANIAGTISEKERFTGSAFNYSIDAPDIAPLTSLLNVQLTDQVPVTLEGSARVESAGIAIEKLDAKLSNTDLSATGFVNLEPTDERFDLQTRWRGANLAAALRPIEPLATAPAPAVSFDASARLQLTGYSLLVDKGQSKLGTSSVGFDGKINFASTTPAINARITGNGENLAELLSGLDIEGVPPGRAFEADGRLTTSADAIRVDDLALKLPNGTIDLSIEASGKDYSRLAFDLDARGANLANILPDVESWEPESIPFDIKTRGIISNAIIDIDAGSVMLGDAKIDLAGEVELEPQLRVRNIQLQAAGPRLSVIGKVNEWEFADLPFEFSAAVEGTQASGDFNDLQFKVGESNLNGRVRVSTETERQNIELALTSTFFNLDEVLAVDTQDGADSAQDDSGTASADDRILSDQPLPFGLFDGIDGKLKIEFADFINEKRRYRSVSADATLNNGAIDVQQFTLTSSAGSVNATGTVRPGANGRQLQVAITASNATLETADMTPEEIERLPQFAIDTQLAATGNSPQTLAASANGYIWIMGGKGQVRRLRLGKLWGDFATQLINAVNPFARRKEYNRTECMGFYFEITDGKLATSPAMVGQTDEIVILARGTIDLATEQIGLTFQTTPRKGVGISVGDIVNPFTSVGGTLSQPRLTLNKQGSLVEGGAAVATGGLSIFAKSLWQRWVSSRDVCLKIAEEASKTRQQRDPANVPDLAEMAKHIG